LAESYSHKDILSYQNIKYPEILEKLLQSLALQIGNEVSYNELASSVGIDKITVANYVEILEKAFIIYRVRPFSRNLRNELKKMRKIYFYDTGIRNALINNLNPLEIRQDIGALWENFLINERLKKNSNNNREASAYFWRTSQKQEIDYLEEYRGKISGFEFKWKKNKIKKPEIFLKTYPGSSIEGVNQNSFSEFIA
jgi:predicted AAA+ superfamily ATPase